MKATKPAITSRAEVNWAVREITVAAEAAKADGDKAAKRGDKSYANTRYDDARDLQFVADRIATGAISSARSYYSNLDTAVRDEPFEKRPRNVRKILAALLGVELAR